MATSNLSTEDVKGFLTKWARAYDAGDETFFNAFAKDTSVFSVSAPTRIDGLEEYKRGFEDHFGKGNRRSQILSPEIRIEGSTAVATFHNRVSIDGHVSNLRTTLVLSGDSGGDLKIVHLHQSPLSAVARVAPSGVGSESVSLLEERVATAAAAVGTPK
ncbi:nuclear transport factor 2 family protein [Sphingomonas sp. UV9]|uniref:nuclear transport factor 2 family protein n=1 Tax=Sphingomonas sp. UV9 TaxID=1851410 RepID=UPI0013E8DA26|nr:nuclear transport factor 2 family protein [Sphingomonas sp. UV9]